MLNLALGLFSTSAVMLCSRSPSTEALYQPILQGSESVTLSPDQLEVDVEARPSAESATHTKVQCIFFILGCSGLLPWNGEYISCSLLALDS